MDITINVIAELFITGLGDDLTEHLNNQQEVRMCVLIKASFRYRGKSYAYTYDKNSNESEQPNTAQYATKVNNRRNNKEACSLKSTNT